MLGLTFKPNTDDMREAPSIALITALQDMGAQVNAYDPDGMEQAQAVLSRRRSIATAPMPAPRAPTRWSSSPNGTSSARSISPRLKRVMTRAGPVDLRNIYPPEEVERLGFIYHGVGKPQYEFAVAELARAS